MANQTSNRNTRTTTVPKETLETAKTIESAKTKVSEVVEGFSSYVTTPVANNLNLPKLTGAVIGSYVALEVIHHAILGNYVMPYLVTSLGLGTVAATTILYGTLAVSAFGLSWMIYKMFFQKTPKAVTPLKDGEYRLIPVDEHASAAAH